MKELYTMEKDEFIIAYQAYPLSEKVKEAIKKLGDGKDVPPNRFSSQEMNDIGLCYWYGHIVPLNYIEAVKWYHWIEEYERCPYKITETNVASQIIGG